MKNLLLIFCIFFLLVLSGCATIFSGSKEEIEFTSEPAGANIVINNNEEGLTPLKVSLKKGNEYVVEIIKEGFKKKTYRLSYSINTGWLILDIISGLIGIVVDGITGNWYDFDINHYNTVLEKIR